MLDNQACLTNFLISMLVDQDQSVQEKSPQITARLANSRQHHDMICWEQASVTDPPQVSHVCEEDLRLVVLLSAYYVMIPLGINFEW